MRKTIIKLSMAVLALLGAMTTSCSDIEDYIGDVTTQPTTDKSVTLTTTITLGSSSATRGLTAAGVKTFSAGDKIAVIYENTSTSGNTAKAVSLGIEASNISNNGKTATFTVTLENPKADGKLQYIYPAAMAKADIDKYASLYPNLDYYTVNYDALKKQDGTLTSLAANLDLAIFDGKLTTEAKLPATAALTNPLAIGEFTIQNGGSNITSNITALGVSNGKNYYDVRPTSALPKIYVAMLPATTGDINFFAAAGTTDYRKTVAIDTNHKLEAGTMYPVNLSMTTVTDGSKALERLTADYVAQDGDVLAGTLLGNYKISIANGATVTLSGVNIIGNPNNDGTTPWAGITCEGNATIVLADGTVNTVKSFDGTYACIAAAHNPQFDLNSTDPNHEDEYTLTIQGGSAGTGALIANHYDGDSGGAGIGGNKHSRCGNITIKGGHITAKGATHGAGIGGGGYGQSNIITIEGGTVTATGIDLGAGIGTGYEGHCNEVTIEGGSVTATGGIDAAGIGGGLLASIYKITIGSNITQVKAIRGGSHSSDHPQVPIGDGKDCNPACEVIVEGVSNWTGSNTNSLICTKSSTDDGDSETDDTDNTWTLTPNPNL